MFPLRNCPSATLFGPGELVPFSPCHTPSSSSGMDRCPLQTWPCSLYLPIRALPQGRPCDPSRTNQNPSLRSRIGRGEGAALLSLECRKPGDSCFCIREEAYLQEKMPGLTQGKTQNGNMERRTGPGRHPPDQWFQWGGFCLGPVAMSGAILVVTPGVGSRSQECC